jgi:hypothetical protein
MLAAAVLMIVPQVGGSVETLPGATAILCVDGLRAQHEGYGEQSKDLQPDCVSTFSFCSNDPPKPRSKPFRNAKSGISTSQSETILESVQSRSLP